jgi:hypothetical protein
MRTLPPGYLVARSKDGSWKAGRILSLSPLHVDFFQDIPKREEISLDTQDDAVDACIVDSKLRLYDQIALNIQEQISSRGETRRLTALYKVGQVVWHKEAKSRVVIDDIRLKHDQNYSTWYLIDFIDNPDHALVYGTLVKETALIAINVNTKPITHYD